MSDLNLQIVREFFELNLFHVLTYWQHENLPRLSDASLLLFAEQSAPAPQRAVDFVLGPDDISSIGRAVVEVRAWHADRFYPSVIESNPVLGHVAGAETQALAQLVFNSTEFRTLLVVSALPASTGPRERSVQLLKDLDIDHVIEFPTILQQILERISAHGDYTPSQTLQTMRLLKRYNLIRRQQLEFAFPTAVPPVSRPVVEAEVLPEEPDDAE